MFFEVPLLEVDPLFTGRSWLLQELKSVIEGSSHGALIIGYPGTGKTSIILQLVQRSCFGRKKNPVIEPEDLDEIKTLEEYSCSSSATVNLQQTDEKVCSLIKHCRNLFYN